MINKLLNIKDLLIVNMILYITFTILIGWFPLFKVINIGYASNGLLGLSAIVISIILFELFIYYIFKAVDSF